MLDEVQSRWTSMFHVKHGPLISGDLRREDLRCEDLGRRWRSIPSRSGHLEGGASRIGAAFSLQPSDRRLVMFALESDLCIDGSS